MATTTYPEPPAGATRRRWVVDPRRSRVEFRVPTFWGLSTVVGHFDQFDGSYGRDGDEVPAIELTIDAGSLDTDTKTRDKHLRISPQLARQGQLPVTRQPGGLRNRDGTDT